VSPAEKAPPWDTKTQAFLSAGRCPPVISQPLKTRHAIAVPLHCLLLFHGCFPLSTVHSFLGWCFPAPILARYAGRMFEREEDVAAGGQLVVKGIRSMWRQVRQYRSNCG